MSKLSFTCFCIEEYADYKNTTSTNIYKRFKDSGLLKLLDTDYEDLHGMGIEWLCQFFDEYLEREKHALVRSILVPDIVCFTMEKYGCSQETALDLFYTSKTAEALNDVETGLYGQSALYIFSYLCDELEFFKRI